MLYNFKYFEKSNGFNYYWYYNTDGKAQYGITKRSNEFRNNFRKPIVVKKGDIIYLDDSDTWEMFK